MVNVRTSLNKRGRDHQSRNTAVLPHTVGTPPTSNPAYTMRAAPEPTKLRGASTTGKRLKALPEPAKVTSLEPPTSNRAVTETFEDQTPPAPLERQSKAGAQEDSPSANGGASRAAGLKVDHSYTDFSGVTDESLRRLDSKDVEWAYGGKGLSCGEATDLSETLKKRRKGGEGSSNIETASKEEDEALKELMVQYGSDGPARKNSGGVVKPFPERLMEVLDRGDMEDIIRWMPHGRAFIVRQPKAFSSEVLPRFFKQSKFMSFTRQLNLWGFKRITRGTDQGAYYHELFLRGRPMLSTRMKRQKIKGTGIKLTPNPDKEPNFYKLAQTRPLPDPPQRTKPVPPLPPINAIPHHNTKKHIALLEGNDEETKAEDSCLQNELPRPGCTPGFASRGLFRIGCASQHHEDESCSAISQPELPPQEVPSVGLPLPIPPHKKTEDTTRRAMRPSLFGTDGFERTLHSVTPLGRSKPEETFDPFAVAAAAEASRRQSILNNAAAQQVQASQLLAEARKRREQSAAAAAAAAAELQMHQREIAAADAIAARASQEAAVAHARGLLSKLSGDRPSPPQDTVVMTSQDPNIARLQRCLLDAARALDPMATASSQLPPPSSLLDGLAGLGVPAAGTMGAVGPLEPANSFPPRQTPVLAGRVPAGLAGVASTQMGNPLFRLGNGCHNGRHTLARGGQLPSAATSLQEEYPYLQAGRR